MERVWPDVGGRRGSKGARDEEMKDVVGVGAIALVFKYYDCWYNNRGVLWAGRNALGPIV